MVYRGSTSEDVEACVARFHEALASGRAQEAQGLFSFEGAYEYWTTLAVAFGRKCPDAAQFRQAIVGVFSDARVHSRETSYGISGVRSRTIGAIASVVFDRSCAPSGSETAVATVIRDADGWKVRTYPGVFPGGMMNDLRGRASGHQ
jgi:hypothetical protein